MMGIVHAIPSPHPCVRRVRSDRLKAVSESTSVHYSARPPIKHLIVESNGLFGYPGNWDVINKYLREHLDMGHYVIHASRVNQKQETFDGVDVCGQRLAHEIQDIIARHPELEYISMIGHSMGGLMLRYAAGYLYDRDEQRIAGLTPVRFHLHR